MEPLFHRFELLELCGPGYAHFGGGFDKTAAVLGDEGKPG
jgi:hypothetical protein